MAKFTDARGKSWLVEITIGAYRRLKRDTPLDLDKFAADGSQLVEIIYGPPFALAAVAECLLGEQVKASGLTPEEFADAFDPLTVDRFGDALMESIVDFFHRGRATGVKAALAQRLQAINEKATEALTIAVTGESPSSKPPTKPLASSDSTPPPSASANSRGCLPKSGV